MVRKVLTLGMSFLNEASKDWIDRGEILTSFSLLDTVYLFLATPTPDSGGCQLRFLVAVRGTMGL